MKERWLLFVIGVLVGGAVVGSYLYWQQMTQPANTPTPIATVTTTPQATATSHPLIRVTAPAANATIQNPLTVTGEARGPWYFEASFPIKLLNAEGTVIATTPAQAQGEWMTENFVPFSATLMFTPSAAGTTGTLVFEKSNASGLPENADAYRIPVTF